MTPNKHIEKKIKEFEEQGLLYLDFCGDDDHECECSVKDSQIKDFLRTSLAEAYLKGQDSVKEDVKKWAEEKKDNLRLMSKTDEKAIQQTHGYDVAMAGLLSLLSNISKLQDK